MVQIKVVSKSFWDDTKEVFINLEERVLSFEHSLASVSKWESFFEKPWFPKTEDDKMTAPELLKYIEFMCLDKDVDSLYFEYMSDISIKILCEYIYSKQTATTVKQEPKSKTSNEFTTSELLYYLMDSHNINWEAQYWHLNRLLTLISVHHAKSKAPKKMSPNEVIAQNRAVNAKRRAQLKGGR